MAEDVARSLRTTGVNKMLTSKESKDTILYLRSQGYSISGIHAVTGRNITEICEVIWSHKFDQEENLNEQNQKDIVNDSSSNSNWNGVF